MDKGIIIKKLKQLKDQGKLKQAIELAKKYLKEKDEDAEIWRLKGYCHLLMGQDKLFLNDIKKGLKLALKGKDKKVLSNLFASLGNYYHLKRKFQKAKVSYQKALYFAKQAKDKHRQGTVIVNLATLYGNLKNYEMAKKMFSYLIRNFSKDKKVYANVLWELAKIKRIEGNLDKAIALVEKGLKIAKRINLVNTIADLYRELGRIYKEYAKQNYQKALEIYHRYNYRSHEKWLKKEIKTL